MNVVVVVNVLVDLRHRYRFSRLTISLKGSVIGCEYLFLNGAKMDCKDGKGRTPLHFASDLGLTG